MQDSAHAADAIVQEVFTPFFPGALSPSLGREIYLTIRRRLRARRCGGEEHAEEVFQRVVIDAYFYLKRHGSHAIRHTRGWLHRISLNATRHYLSELSRNDSSTSPLQELLEGKAQLPDNSNSDRIDLQQILQAIKRLRPRHQEVIRLDLVAGLSAQEIQERMQIDSYAYFRKLKCEAFKALRKELQKQPAKLSRETRVPSRDDAVCS